MRRRSGLRLHSEIDESTPPAWSDPDALRHLADILLRNAIQATPSGGRIQVGSRMQKDGLLWWFGNSGRGLDATEAAHLFDPFYCGRQAGRGLGLGLPRAARIVASVGGRIRWTSHPGQGTVFHVHLPLSEPPAQPDNETTSSARPHRNSRRQPKSRAATVESPPATAPEALIALNAVVTTV